MNLSDCLVKIYDAATSEQQWDETMDAISHYMGAKGAILVQLRSDDLLDIAPNRASELWRSFPPDVIQTVVNESRKYDRDAWLYTASRPCLEPILDTSMMSAELLDARPDLLMLRERYGMGRRVALNLSDHPGWLELLGVQYDKDMPVVTPECTAAMLQVSPHIAKVAEISRTFSQLEQKYRAALLALDNIHIGVCVAHRNGEILLANSEAQRILDAKDGISLTPSKHLATKYSDKTHELKTAINAAIATVGGQSAQTEWIFACERASASKPLLIEVTPITDGLHELDKGFQGALVYIIDPENPAPLKVARLAAACGLSDAESAVGEKIAHGWTNADIADDRGVTLDTIKTQVASIFAKTSVRNRSELVRLILKASPPVG